jgi:hypothetical protein
MSTPLAPAQPLDLTESAAGEEDPGAGIETPMSPGDEARPGTPGTGEDICPRAGRDCPTCQGTGKVTTGIGGA